jgi:hemerythrin superfamily protein
MKKLTFKLEFITPDSYDETVASSMSLDDLNEDHWSNMDVYLDMIKLTKVTRDIKLTGDAKDFFEQEGIYSN